MAAGLDAVLKAARGEWVGRLGWWGPTLSQAPSLLPGNPSGQQPQPSPTQPAGGLAPAWPLGASYLQITLSVGLGQLRCWTTKSLPPIMEPE